MHICGLFFENTVLLQLSSTLDFKRINVDAGLSLTGLRPVNLLPYSEIDMKNAHMRK